MKDRQGFTLIELMIVVAIIGIIAAVAIPSYSGHVTRTKRTDAIRILQEVALYEEKAMAETGSYVLWADLIGTNPGQFAMPNPNADGNRNYVTNVNRINATTFIAYAVPSAETGVGDKFKDDYPGTGDPLVFAVHSDGRTGRSDATGTAGSFAEDNDLWKTLRP